VLCFAPITAATATRCRVYTVFDGAGGDMLWHANDARCFIGIRHIGHDVNLSSFSMVFCEGPRGRSRNLITTLGRWWSFESPHLELNAMSRESILNLRE